MHSPRNTTKVFKADRRDEQVSIGGKEGIENALFRHEDSTSARVSREVGRKIGFHLQGRETA